MSENFSIVIPTGLLVLKMLRGLEL